MVVGADGALPLPWLEQPLRAALDSQRGHALLLHGAEGSGTGHLATTLAQAWLCEHATARRPCGQCPGCRLVQSHSHPDLFVLMPESLRRSADWPLVSASGDGDDASRKPSRQIRIDEVRQLIDWTTRTSGRGGIKVAVLHPAETLNLQSANALLKTLEEPPAGTRLLLTAADPQRLLPTLRSRCQRMRMFDPPKATALQWLRGQSVADPEVLLDAAGGRPLDALALARAGVDAKAWSALPTRVASGQGDALSSWAPALAIDAMLKLCHDALTRRCGGLPRYFPSAGVPDTASPVRLLDWRLELQRLARHAEHPWNEPLLAEALARGGARALAPIASARRPSRGLDTLPS